jgi:hypothetical protein
MWSRIRPLFGGLCGGFLTLAACTNSSPSMPPVLGNCVPIGDAGCKVNPGSAGIGSGPSGDQDGGTSDGEDAGTCGVVHMLFSASCPSCAVTSCCMADFACSEGGSAIGTCSQVVSCIVTCQGDMTCIAANCGTNSQSAAQAYEDFAACLNASCPAPQCPTLPSLVQNDF